MVTAAEPRRAVLGPSAGRADGRTERRRRGRGVAIPQPGGAAEVAALKAAYYPPNRPWRQPNSRERTTHNARGASPHPASSKSRWLRCPRRPSTATKATSVFMLPNHARTPPGSPSMAGNANGRTQQAPHASALEACSVCDRLQHVVTIMQVPIASSWKVWPPRCRSDGGVLRQDDRAITPARNDLFHAAISRFTCSATRYRGKPASRQWA